MTLHTCCLVPWQLNSVYFCPLDEQGPSEYPLILLKLNLNCLKHGGILVSILTVIGDSRKCLLKHAYVSSESSSCW